MRIASCVSVGEIYWRCELVAKNRAVERLYKSIGVWTRKLDDYPGWRDWKRGHIGYTLNYDNDFSSREMPSEFEFTPEIEKEHKVLLSYLELHSTSIALGEVEWYFRRYPFAKTPVTREAHLRNCCEMYFGRFYEFREKLKKLSKATKSALPNNQLDFGRFIKEYDKSFNEELRARNSIHHHERFDDIGISRVAIFEVLGTTKRSSSALREDQYYYRKTVREWANRVRRRSELLDQYVEAIAEALLRECPFLEPPRG